MSRSRNSVLETINVNEIRKHNADFQKQKDAKINIYKAFEDYILCLEALLEYEEDSYKKCLIEKEIKELKKEQKKYYVPSVLEMAVYDRRVNKDNRSELEESSFSLIKKIRKK